MHNTQTVREIKSDSKIRLYQPVHCCIRDKHIITYTCWVAKKRKSLFWLKNKSITIWAWCVCVCQKIERSPCFSVNECFCIFVFNINFFIQLWPRQSFMIVHTRHWEWAIVWARSSSLAGGLHILCCSCHQRITTRGIRHTQTCPIQSRVPHTPRTQ